MIPNRRGPGVSRTVWKRLSLAAAAATLCMPAAAAVVTWVGPNNSFWDVASNWSPGLPGSADDALLGVFDTQFRGGAVTVHSLSGTGSLTLTGGTLSFLAASSIGELHLVAGTLSGAGALAVADLSTWTNATLGSGATIGFGGNLNISGNGSRAVSGATVNFNSITNWANTGASGFGSINVSNGATLNNNGVWVDDTTFGTGFQNLGGAASTFNNNGVYTKAGSTTTGFQSIFNNAAGARVELVAGTIGASGGGTISGVINVGSGATFNLSGGTFTVNGLGGGGGGGLLTVGGGVTNASGSNGTSGLLGISGGTLNVAGTFDAGGFAATSGTLAGTGTVNATGNSTWTNGTLSGTTTTNFAGNLAIAGNGTRAVSGATVNFNGVTTWTNTGASGFGSINVSNGATLNNNGTWLDQTTFSTALQNLGGAASTFNNAGTYIKSGSSITDASNIRYVNTGVTRVLQGTMRLPTAFSNVGTLEGTGTFAAGTITNNGHVAPGMSPGTLSISGNYVQGTGGYFDVDLRGPGNGDHDLLNVSGSATLAGTLNLICFDNCTMAAGATFRILDAAPGSLAGSFASVILVGFATGDFVVSYDSALGDVWIKVTQDTTPAVPEPPTAALLSIAAAFFCARRWRRNGRGSLRN